MSKIIYLDAAATTPADPEVVKAMQPYFTEKFGNASTLYSLGRESRAAIDNARQTVADFIGAKDKEIVFTSGGTESDNFAIKGVAFANEQKGKHIITSAVEHHAVIEPCKFLEKRGFKVTYLPVDKYGFVNPEDVKKTLTKETILVSIMHANNEVGTVQPIEQIGKIVKEHPAYFHVDAVQSLGRLPINVDKMQADLVSFSSHKIYGPKGVGALYVRSGTKMVAYQHGGEQERRRRAGTENIPGIVGFGKAVEIAGPLLANKIPEVAKLRDKLIQGLLDKTDYSHLNGHPTKRLPNNVNIGFEYIEGESIILNLDFLGVCASTGSACSSSTLEPSHVLLALGQSHEVAHGSVRMTLTRYTTEEDIDFVLEKLPLIVEKLRSMSPLFEERTNKFQTPSTK
ncbi:MAG: cysteine desulfurase NifS [Actinobacteria bacterium]|nr:MAG: cysteine desulfurase NifS [Actinomycetota bacterium]